MIFYSRKLVYKILALLFTVFALLILGYLLYPKEKNATKTASQNNHKSELQAKHISVFSESLPDELSFKSRVLGEDELNLSFKKSGKVLAVFKKDGDYVRQGETIASLENRIEKKRLEQAKAAVRLAEINLEKALKGASDKDLKLAQKSLDQAKIQYKASKHALEDSAENLKNASEQAMRIADEYFIFENTESPELRVKDIFAKDRIILENKRLELKNYFKKFSKFIDELKSTNDKEKAKQISNKAIGLADKIEDFLKYFKDATEDASVAHPNSFELERLKAELIHAKSIFLPAKQALRRAKDNFDLAYSSLELAKTKYENLKSPARQEDIESLKEQLKNAKANLDIAKQDYENTLLIAPISGILSNFDLSAGDNARAFTPYGKLSSHIKKLELFIPEKVASNIAQIFVNDHPAHDYEISSYTNNFSEKKLAIRLNKNYELGSLLNVKIKTKNSFKKLDNVFTLPIYSIYMENGEKFILFSDLKNIQKVKVELLSLSLQNAKLKIKKPKNMDYIIINPHDYIKGAAQSIKIKE